MLKQTVHAFEINLTSNVTMVARQEAGRYIETLKASRECMAIMLEILTTTSIDPSVQQLALGVLNDWLKKWWNRIDCNDQNQLRGAYVALLSQDVVGLSPNRSLRIKLAVAIANIAERQFPQLWPTFIDEMVIIWRSSPLERQEIVITALETMIVDCIDSDFNSFLPMARRQDIIAGFKLQLELVFQTAYESLTDNIIKYQQYPIGSAESSSFSRVANVTMKMIRAFVQFKKAIDACKDPHDFSVLSLGMLGISGLQMEAAKLLGSLTEEKIPVELFGKLLQSIPNAPMTSAYPADLSECITFQRHCAEAVFSLLGQNIGQAVEPSFLAMPTAPELLGQYVTLMAKLMESPSRRLACEVLKDWMRIFKEGSITRLPWMGQVSRIVLDVYHARSVHCGWTSRVSHSVGEVDAAEFDDYDEYDDFMSKFQSNIRLLVELIAKKFPSVCTAFVLEKVSFLVHAHPGVVADATKDLSLAKREWEAFLVFLQVVFKNITEEVASSDASIAPTLTATLDALLAWAPQDLSLVKLRIKATQLSAPILKLSPVHLTRAFMVLLDLVGNESANASAAVSHLCEKCSVEILSSNLGATLLPKLLELVSHPSISAHEKASMRESVVALSESVADSGERSKLLMLALREMVESWNQCSSVFVSPQCLLQCSYNNGAGGGLAATITLLNCILTVSKKVTAPKLPDEVWSQGMGFTMDELIQVFPFAPMWQAVLPGITAAIVALNGLWAPEFRSQLAGQEIAAMYVPTVAELRVLGAVRSESPTKRAAETCITSVRRELTELRNTLYQLLGQASAHKTFFVCSATSEACLVDMAAALPHMENTHLSMLMSRFVEPHVLNAPPATYAVTSVFLSAFLRHLLHRLGMIWDQNSSSSDHAQYRRCGLPGAEGQPYEGMSREEVELASDRIIGDLTKSYADVLGALGLCRGFLSLSVPDAVTAATQSGSVATSPTADATEAMLIRDRHKAARRSAILNLMLGPNSGAVTRPFVESAIALICIPDADACKFGLMLAKSLCERCLIDNRLLLAVGRDGFSAALMVLLKAEKFSVGMEWQVVDFLQEVYCGFVLGYPLGDLTGPGSALNFMCDSPRQVLLLVPGNSTDDVLLLEKQLSGAPSKKRRRDIFKDHVASLIQTNLVERLSGHASLQVMDIRSKFFTSSTKNAQAKNSNKGGLLDVQVDPGLAELFS